MPACISTFSLHPLDEFIMQIITFLSAFFWHGMKQTVGPSCSNNMTRVYDAVRGENNTTKRSSAFLNLCGAPAHSIHSRDWQTYANLTWRSAPERTRSSAASCTSIVRIGPTGEGGKFMCDPDRLLTRKSCLVVSVGLNGDTSFEVSLHSLYPRCSVHGFDGTLVKERAALRSKLPEFLKFHPHNFDSKTYEKFAGVASVDVLKIDCDTCEHRDLLPWVQHVCTDQILLEYHTGPRWQWACGPFGTTPARRIHEMHRLFSALEQDFDIYAYEDNEIVASRGHPGFCGEYALKRRRPCVQL